MARDCGIITSIFVQAKAMRKLIEESHFYIVNIQILLRPFYSYSKVRTIALKIRFSQEINQKKHLLQY